MNKNIIKILDDVDKLDININYLFDVDIMADGQLIKKQTKELWEIGDIILTADKNIDDLTIIINVTQDSNNYFQMPLECFENYEKNKNTILEYIKNNLYNLIYNNHKYKLVWIHEEEKWYIFENSENIYNILNKRFKDGYVDYDLVLNKDFIIIDNTYDKKINNNNIYKIFKGVKIIEKKEFYHD